MKTLLLLLCWFGLRLGADAQEALSLWDVPVGGAMRQALLYLPANAATAETPVVFAFHGHGGRSEGAARMFAVHKLWPEAITVYPQGLNTPGRLTDPEGKKPGWQHRAGDQGDRDLLFFDALLARLQKEFKVDRRRIFSMGHSNGGGFSYLLWAERGDVFAAMGPSGSVALSYLPKMRPKPVLHIAGEKDPLVKYEWQKAGLDGLRKLNGCAAGGTAWAPMATRYDSPGHTPLVTYIHPGGHEYPQGAAAAVVRFFKEWPTP